MKSDFEADRELERQSIRDMCVDLWQLQDRERERKGRPDSRDAREVCLEDRFSLFYAVAFCLRTSLMLQFEVQLSIIVQAITKLFN